MKLYFGRYLFFLAMLLLVVACAEEECTNLDDPQLTVQFKHYEITATKAKRIRDTALVIQQLYGLGKSPDVSLATAGKHTSVILPLSQLSDQTTFVMVYRFGDTTTLITDTLVLQYERQTFFVSDICGFNVRFKNLKIDTLQSSFNKPDSIAVIKNTVDQENTGNINIFFPNL